MNVESRTDALLIGASLIVAAFVLAPGLTGGFHFDDTPNFMEMFGAGAVSDWNSLLRFVTSGSADPGGRPIALLSFLPQDAAWPDSPERFLAVNVLLHLANATLLFVFLRFLRPKEADVSGWRWTCIAVTGFWLLHPLHVSTVLYAIQREAMLPATFALLTFIAYIQGRRQFFATDGKRGTLLLVLAVLIGTGLAAGSKANGLLVPSLLLVLEGTLLPSPASVLGPAARQRFRIARALLLVTPTALVVGYLGWTARNWDTAPGVREWTIYQRLITEPRILFDYIGLLLIPRASSSGLYNDDLVASSNLLDPISTLICSAALLALSVVALRLRRKRPFWAAGILFFLVGHLMESTTLPLELYYEHRNYLPSLLFFLPFVYSLFTAPSLRGTAMSIIVVIAMLLAYTTYQRSSLWGDPARLAASWLLTNPESSRANAAAAQIDVRRGNAERAVHRLQAYLTRHPDDLQVGFAHLAASCAHDGFSVRDGKALAAALSRANSNLQFVNLWLTRTIRIAESGSCRALDLREAGILIDAAMQNPSMNRQLFKEVELYPVLGRWNVAIGRPDTALAFYNRTLERTPRAAIAASQASDFALHGYFGEALRHLDYFDRLPPYREARQGMPAVHSLVLARQGYWEQEIRRLRRDLLAAQGSSPAARSKPR